MNHYDVVTFDMGHTLIYFHPYDNEVYLRALRSLDLHPEPEALSQVRDRIWDEYAQEVAGITFEPTVARDRKTEEDLARRTLLGLGHDDPLLAPQLAAAVKAAFRAPGVVRLFPEVVEVLEALRQAGCTLAIISNWGWDLNDYVEQVDLTRHFDLIVGSARTGCEKPHPEIFHHTLRQLGASPERALHIGDKYEADVVGARGVGMGALWLDREGSGKYDDCPVIRDLTEVLQHVLP